MNVCICLPTFGGMCENPLLGVGGMRFVGSIWGSRLPDTAALMQSCRLELLSLAPAKSRAQYPDSASGATKFQISHSFVNLTVKLLQQYRLNIDQAGVKLFPVLEALLVAQHPFVLAPAM